MAENEGQKYCNQTAIYRAMAVACDPSRRKWEQTYGSWFPAAQHCRNCHVDRVYREVRDKYGDDLFKTYVQERRLNKRIFHDIELDEDEQDEYIEFKSLKPHAIDGQLPLTYFEYKCDKPTPCLQFCKKTEDPKK